MRRRPELLAALLLAAACRAHAPAVEPTLPARAAAPLSDDAITTIAQLLAMQDARVLDPTLLAQSLAHAHPEVRKQAALAGGRIGDDAAAPLLRVAASDSSELVAANAAFALGELGDTTNAGIHALLELAGPPGWTRAAVAAEALHALGKLNAEDGRAALEQVLLNDAPAAIVREALLAAWKLRRNESTVRAVAGHLADADAETRWRAAYALMRMGDPATAGELRAALGDADYRVRALAARALRASVVDSAGLREPSIPALAAALRDAHPHVVINAARALAGYQDRAQTSRLTGLLESGDANVAIAAAQALADQNDPATAVPLAGLARNANAPLAVRAAALASHARLAAAAAAAIADTWAEEPEWLTRLYAARALAGAPWPQVRGTLTRLARDPDPRVVAEAIGAVTASTDTLDAGYAFYIEGLGSGDVMVRAAAVRGLLRRASPTDLPVLLDAYARAQTDTLNDAALATVAALGRLKAAGTPVERAFFTRFRRSPHALVRQAVAAALGDAWGSPLPVETDRTAADYEHIVRTLIAPALGGVAPPRVRIRTGRGDIVLELTPVEAPLTVQNMLGLVREGFYTGANLRWHRVVPNFVLQDGDPRGDGNGGPAHAIRDEMNRLRYDRGALGMALSGPDTGGSQFFITHSAQPHLDGGYTVFGRVVAGMEVADAVTQDDRILAIEVVQ
jgi:peptidylprolyl isomerase